jgi:hypothetical protein
MCMFSSPVLSRLKIKYQSKLVSSNGKWIHFIWVYCQLTQNIYQSSCSGSGSFSSSLLSGSASSYKK